MASPLTIICPVGDKFGTVKSHSHGTLGFYGIDPDDSYLASNDRPVYTEVTHEEWALFALNARSMNATAVFASGLGPFTMWRSSRPDVSYFETQIPQDEEVGRESSSLYLTVGSIPPNIAGALHFSPLPWIFAGFGINQPNPGIGLRNFYFNPKCYVFEGKFYIGIPGSTYFESERVTVNGSVFTYYRKSFGIPEISSDVFEITSTFYPTS